VPKSKFPVISGLFINSRFFLPDGKVLRFFNDLWKPFIIKGFRHRLISLQQQAGPQPSDNKAFGVLNFLTVKYLTINAITFLFQG
jgi:hypothetical protein